MDLKEIQILENRFGLVVVAVKKISILKKKNQNTSQLTVINLTIVFKF
jgi:hypothetical protein